MLGLAFSPDDAQLVSCSSDHSVKVSVRVRVRVRVRIGSEEGVWAQGWGLG